MFCFSRFKKSSRDVLNLSKFLLYRREMMLKARENMSNVDFFNKTNKFVNRKVWPSPKLQLQQDWTRDPCLQQMFKRPDQPGSQTILRSDALINHQGTIDQNDRESFHCAMSSILLVAQGFGILPVAGICTESPRKLVFKLFSPRTAYTATIVVMLSTMASIAVIHMIQSLSASAFGIQGAVAAATAGAVFYSNSLLGTVLFAWLAPQWGPLQQDWRAMERHLDRSPSEKYQSPRLRWKFALITGTIMICALMEHSLSIVDSTPSKFWSSNSNYTFEDFLQSYSEQSHAFIFTVCDYNLAFGIFIFCISKFGTFAWNFTDVFIILIATGLSERYKLLNQRLLANATSCRGNVDWREFRECYAIMSTLVKKVDDKVSPIMLLSFANNLYFICLQLLNGLSTGQHSILRDMYFFGSFVFLLCRTIAVTLFTARINDQSKLALPALYKCPGPTYNIETQRLQQQLTTDDICLTGMKFFCVTRNFMLAVAGAILTYEVVLLQFNVAVHE